MPTRTYRLCGFAKGVDWRPVTFKEPLPPTRECHMCSCVPIKMAILPCGHALCSSCLDGCTSGDGHPSCAVDSTPFELDVNVCWISAARDHLAKLKVSCWNAEHGCSFEGPAEELLEHFEKQCAFHGVPCRRCGEIVLSKDMPVHYRGNCSGSASLRGKDSHSVAVYTPGSMQELDAMSCSYHDILTSLQSSINEMAETLDGLSARLVAYTEEFDEPRTRNEPMAEDIGTLLVTFNNTNAALMEGFRSLKRSVLSEVLSALPRSLEDALIRSQQVLAPAPVQTALCGSSVSGAVSNGTAIDDSTVCMVLTIVPEDWEDEEGYLARYQFVKDMPIVFDQFATGFNVACLLCRKSNFITVYARQPKPTEWDLLGVQELNSSDLSSQAIRGSCVEYAERKHHSWQFYQRDKVFKCMSTLSELEGETHVYKTKIDFLLQFKRKIIGRDFASNS